MFNQRAEAKPQGDTPVKEGASPSKTVHQCNSRMVLRALINYRWLNVWLISAMSTEQRKLHEDVLFTRVWRHNDKEVPRNAIQRITSVVL